MNSNLVELTVPMPGNEDMIAAQQMLRLAEAYEITSVEMYQAAAEDLRALKTRAKSIEDKRKSMVQPLDQARQAIQNFFRPAQTLFDQAESIIKRAMIAFDNEQDRIRREEEAKQRRAIEEEQRRLAAIAEEKAAEQRRLDEAARKAAEAGQHDKAEQLERESQARLQESNAARDAAITMPTAIVTATEAPKAEGVSFTETWSAEVVDLMTLVEAVAAGNAPLACLQADMKVLNAQASALKAQLNYPGVKAVATKNVSARRVA